MHVHYANRSEQQAREQQYDQWRAEQQRLIEAAQIAQKVRLDATLIRPITWDFTHKSFACTQLASHSAVPNNATTDNSAGVAADTAAANAAVNPTLMAYNPAQGFALCLDFVLGLKNRFEGCIVSYQVTHSAQPH